MKPLEEMGKYATVVIDPPWPMPSIGWKQNGHRRRVPYETMTIEQICALPIAPVLSEHSFVFLWTTNTFFPIAFQVLHSWGVDYQCMMVWVKTGGPQLPGRPCYNAEYCIVGRQGKPQFLDTRAFALANTWPRRGHSEKPEEFYDLLRRVTLGPRLDIFGRRRIAGFESWGDEAPEGPALPSHYQTVFA